MKIKTIDETPDTPALVDELKEIDQLLEDHAKRNPPGKFTDYRVCHLLRDLFDKMNSPFAESHDLLQHHAGCDNPSVKVEYWDENNQRMKIRIQSEEEVATFVIGWKRIE